MTRSRYVAIMIACLVAGTALGQPTPQPALQPPPPVDAGPKPPPDPPPSAPATLTPPPPAPSPSSLIDPCPAPCDATRFWVNADYLLGWTRGERVPALVTTSPPGTPQSAAGVLGPSSSVLFGATTTNTQTRSGGRIDLGFCFGPERVFAFESGFFMLGSTSSSFAAASDGTSILARPFTDVTTGAAASALVAFPGLSSGSILINESSRNLYGGNVDLRENWLATAQCRLDALVGYRYLAYNERLEIGQSLQPTSGPFVAGTSIQSTDSFATRNIFNGVDMGFRTELCRGDWTLELLTKVAVGSLRRTVIIDGSQVVSVPGADPVTSQGGLLALSSNIGTHSHDSWDAVPELGITLGWDLTQQVRLRAGYSVLWFLRTARAGEQIDLGINPGLIPPATATTDSAARPAFAGQTSTLWSQALSLGLEVRF